MYFSIFANYGLLDFCFSRRISSHGDSFLRLCFRPFVRPSVCLSGYTEYNWYRLWMEITRNFNKIVIFFNSRFVTPTRELITRETRFTSGTHFILHLFHKRHNISTNISSKWKTFSWVKADRIHDLLTGRASRDLAENFRSKHETSCFPYERIVFTKNPNSFGQNTEPPAHE